MHSAERGDALPSFMPSRESTSASPPAIESAGSDGDFEGRWNAWRARGVTQDRALLHRLQELIPAIVIVAVLVYAFIVFW